MSGAYSSWTSALVAALVMIALGVRLDLLALRKLTTRCAACGRFLRSRSECPCTRLDED
jgi:hypothetical protein